jgi:hypothetical protein
MPAPLTINLQAVGPALPVRLQSTVQEELAYAHLVMCLAVSALGLLQLALPVRPSTSLTEAEDVKFA